MFEALAQNYLEVLLAIFMFLIISGALARSVWFVAWGFFAEGVVVYFFSIRISSWIALGTSAALVLLSALSVYLAFAREDDPTASPVRHPGRSQ